MVLGSRRGSGRRVVGDDGFLVVESTRTVDLDLESRFLANIIVTKEAG